MAYKCIICGKNEVLIQDGICEMCALGENPDYQSSVSNNSEPIDVVPNVRKVIINNSQPAPTKTMPKRQILINGNNNPAVSSSNSNYNVQTQSDNSIVQNKANHKAQIVASKKTANTFVSKKDSPLTRGIAKNITVDKQKKSALLKIFKSLFSGIPFALDNDITMFQVYPDFSGNAVNAVGNACDQVIVYGKLDAGSVAENNDIEVYGYRDASNNIVVSKIYNKASGTIVKPYRLISAIVLWLLVILAIAVVLLIAKHFGLNGFILIAVILLCLSNFPLVVKIIAGIIGFIASIVFGSTRR